MILEHLFGSASRSKILSRLLLHPDENYYVRELAKLIDEDSTNVSRELRQLEKLGIVRARVAGRQRHYRAATDSPVYPELRGLVAKTSGLADVLSTALAQLRGQIELAFVYGSIAAARETSSSDIDLMIVGKVTLPDIVAATTDAQALLGREINPSVYSAQEFRSKLHGRSHFLTTVARGPKIFLFGTQRELDRLAA